MKIQSFFRLLFITLFISLNSCTSDDNGGSLTGTDLSVSDIQGSWMVTNFIFSSSAEGPEQSIDLIAEGVTATMTIQGDGRFTLSSSFPGEGQESISGQLTFDEDLLVISFDDEPGEDEYFGIQLTNNKNNLFISGPASYDFDDDGNDEPARIEITLVRT